MCQFYEKATQCKVSGVWNAPFVASFMVTLLFVTIFQPIESFRSYFADLQWYMVIILYRYTG